jgi:hypothetical protein
MNKRKILIIFVFLTIACLAVLVWYAPIIFKGYNFTTTGSDALVRARNFALSGRYSSESDLNVILAPSLIASQGAESNQGNKLATVFHGYLIKFFNLDNNNVVVLANCFVLALSLLFLSLAIYYTFGFRTAFFFSLIYIFLPTVWRLPQVMVAHQSPLLWFSLFFLFFSLGSRGFIREDFNFKFFPHGLFLFWAGIFLALGCLSKESFLVFAAILFFFLIWHKPIRKYVLYIFIPFTLLLAVFWLPSFMVGKNIYLSSFSSQTDQKLGGADFGYYAHLYPDPYTYHFDKENFLDHKFNLTNLDTMERLGREKILINTGQLPISFLEKIKIGLSLFCRHLFRFFSITEIGGPFIFLLFFLGLAVLGFKEYFFSAEDETQIEDKIEKIGARTYWLKFISCVVLFSFLFLSFAHFGGRNYLMEFAWLIALGVALGMILLVEQLNKRFVNWPRKIMELFLLLIVIYNLVLCGHVMWGQSYNQSEIPLLAVYINKIKNTQLNEESIIAMPVVSAGCAYNINFNTGRSVVVFAPETITQLLENKKLEEIFKKFKVTHLLGYTPELTVKIVKNIPGVIVITDSNVSMAEENKAINNKNWFLNLVK